MIILAVKDTRLHGIHNDILSPFKLHLEIYQKVPEILSSETASSKHTLCCYVQAGVCEPLKVAKEYEACIL